jgi:cytidylate kinase
VRRSIEQLVNQQILRWTEEQRVAQRRLVPPDDVSKPVVCISREFGAQAGDLARRVASRLDFDVCDQELVDEVAKQAHVRRQVVESLDERMQSGIRQWVDEMMEQPHFTPSDYLRNLSQVVLTLGTHGRSVIIGRGAHLILDPAQTLRVRCYAPFAWRVEQVAARHGISVSRAEVLTTRVDGERTEFYRRHFNADVADPSAFDLMINVSTTSLGARTAMVVDAFESKFPERDAPPQSGIVFDSRNELGKAEVG